MNLSEYASYDALGLSDLVRSKSVKPGELVDCALHANALVHPQINAVIAMPPDWELQIHARQSDGPFLGVPFVIKDLSDEATLFNLGGQLELASPWAHRKPEVHVSRFVL
jgi:amidase